MRHTIDLDYVSKAIVGIASPVVGLTRSAVPATLKPSPIRQTAELASGLNYRYFEAPAGTDWEAIPDFKKLIPVREGAVSEPDLSPRLRRTHYAFDFSGLIETTTPGIHDFTLVYASGATLTIDGTPVIVGDGYHSIGNISGAIPLAAGNQPSGNRGSNKRWMKLQRSGNDIIESLSEDGQSWTVNKTVTLPKLNPTIHAGFYIYALPSSTRLLHHAIFDHVSLTPGAVKNP